MKDGIFPRRIVRQKRRARGRGAERLNLLGERRTGKEEGKGRDRAKPERSVEQFKEEKIEREGRGLTVAWRRGGL